MSSEGTAIAPGHPMPLGATPRDGGVNFAIFSRHATQVWLALFESTTDDAPLREIPLDPNTCRIGDVWCVFLPGLAPGACYAYRMDGPSLPKGMHRFNPDRYLIDTYAKCVTGDPQRGTAKCVVVEDAPAEHHTRPRTPLSETIIYETHVKGLTVNPSSTVCEPGTFRGLIEKISYLRELGVTAVELLPVQECGERELPQRNPVTGEALTNYWGYNPVAWFAPTERYAPPAEQIAAFREMVDALHEAGIEVIVDVVFNHTAEHDATGPTLSLRGIDNAVYYLLDDANNYLDLTGCANTVNANHSVVADLIIDCLHYWASVLGVDGFRFDLAAVLNRDAAGELEACAPLIRRIAEDPILRDTKLIAEPWDLAEGFQLGTFGVAPQEGTSRWAEWNAYYRDDVRRFWRGDEGFKRSVALRMSGSPDLYRESGRTPAHSINYVAAHDGFTLRDLVSYNQKHNEANGHKNADGAEDDFSWNCGIEGPTDDADVNALRLRMQKNYLATLFLSLGTPMLLGGDEFGRTQNGNNNAYCQDNEISWYDWTLLDTNAELHRFCRDLIAFRKQNAVFSRNRFLGEDEQAESELLDASGAPQSWEEENACLAWHILSAANDGQGLYLALNPTAEERRFHPPEVSWLVRIDTAAPIQQPDASVSDADGLLLQPKSLVLLVEAQPDQ